MVVRFDTTQKYTNISENCIIGNGEEALDTGAHSIMGPCENVCSPIHKYLLLRPAGVGVKLTYRDRNALFWS